MAEGDSKLFERFCAHCGRQFFAAGRTFLCDETCEVEFRRCVWRHSKPAKNPQGPRGAGGKTLAERLWRKVNKTNACWLWTGRVCRDGYGLMWVVIDGRTTTRRTHRISWELQFGEIPKGMLVMHTCDTPACCNPAHLKLGTNDDNVADMLSKRRQACGENTKASKLTDEQVRQIREEHAATGAEYKFIAAKFGVSAGNVHAIVRRKTWKHLA